MEEAKRFIRFVIPGLALIFQIIILYLMYWNFDIGKIEKFLTLNIAAGVFLISGIIGYIFSSLYFLLHWNVYFRISSKLNYIKILEENNKIFKVKFKKVKIDKIDQKEAWVLINVFWKTLYPNEIETIDKQSGFLCNMLNSLGTTIVTLFFGWLLGSLYLLFNTCHPGISILWYTFGNFMVILIISINYQILAHIIHTMFARAFDLIPFFEEKRSGIS